MSAPLAPRHRPDERNLARRHRRGLRSRPMASATSTTGPSLTRALSDDASARAAARPRSGGKGAGCRGRAGSDRGACRGGAGAHRRSTASRNVDLVGLPRPHHPAPARGATDLADRRRRVAGAVDRHRCGLRLPLGRCRGGRRGRAASCRSIMPRWRRVGEAARGAQYRRRRQRHLDRPGRGRDPRLRHRPGQCADRRLGAHAIPGGRSISTAPWPQQAMPIARFVERFLAHAFFDRAPPKSLDRDDFTAFVPTGLSPADGAATLTAMTAAAAARAAEHFPQPVHRWLVCGGGRRNPVLMAALASLRRHARRSGRGGRLGRRCAGGAGVRLSRRALDAGAAAQPAWHDGGGAPDHRRAAILRTGGSRLAAAAEPGVKPAAEAAERDPEYRSDGERSGGELSG